jgi:iron complex outermembrane receptor protein
MPYSSTQQSARHSVHQTRIVLSAVLLVTFHAAPVYSQEDKDNATPTSLEEVLVTATGTLIRGIAPTGTNVVEIDREAIEITAVTSTNDLLARVPQVTNYFGTVPVPTTNLGAPTNRPNIRELGASGASTTLVLLNSMRLPGAGFQQVSPDPSVIPPAVLERVDVIPDGASALYGSDAVGGVINFVTRREFEGIEFTGRYGKADDYDSKEATLTAGTSWKGGNAYLSAYWTENDSLLGGDRGWISGNHTARGGDDFRINTCTPGNIVSGGVSYDMNTLRPGENLCDITDVTSTLPEQERRTLFASLNHELTDSIYFGLVAYYSKRDVDFAGDTGGVSTGVEGRGQITDANPFFTPVGGENGHEVSYSYDSAVGDAARNWGDYDSYNIIPELVIDLANDWQATLTVNYGASDNSALTRGIDREYEAQALVATTTDTAINPYDVNTTNPDVLSRVTDYAAAVGDSDQEILQVRGIVDGGLFEIPAGEIRLAVGVEYTDQEHKVTQGNATSISNPVTVTTNNSRDIESLFGEIFLPVLGADSPVGGFDLSISGRYDDYSDLGSTTNPKIGFNWLPIEELVIRGTWGTSFQAPSVADSANSVDERAQFLGISPFRAADSSPLDIVRPTILIAGGSDDLEPEEADTWSLGFDWEPGFIDDFKASATYYNVDYENAIVVTPFFEPYFFSVESLEDRYITNPTLEEAQAALDGLRYDGFTSLEELYESGRPPYLITSARRINLGNIETSGIDYNITKAWTLSGVAFTGGIAGNYILERESQPVPGGETIDELDEGLVNRINFSVNLGAYYDKYSAMVTTYYKDGYDNDLTSIDSFTVTNLFLGYEVPVQSWFDSAQITLNIDNITDENPPYVNDFDGIDTGHSFSVGRMFSLGVRLTM